MAQILKLKKDTQKELFECIPLILNRKSENTQKTYYKAYEEFCDIIFTKDVNSVTFSDLKNIEYFDTYKYICELEKKYKYSSIKLKLSAIKYILNELNKIHNDNINLKLFDTDIKKETKLNCTSYGSFNIQEIYGLFDYCKSKNQIQYYYYFMLLFVTAHRANNLAKIKWNDFKEVIEDGEIISVLKIQDKTDIFETPIKYDLFQNMKKDLRKSENQENVFNITTRSALRLLDTFCEENNIDKKSRNLTIHSIKKASGDYVYSQNNDIVKVASHLKHKNIQTSYEKYLNKNTGYKGMPSYTILDNNFKDIEDKLNKKSKEELIQIILKSSSSTIGEILKNL